MLESYRLELWNGKTETVGGTEYPPNGLRMAFLDTIDFNSVKVSEDLTGGHRIEFSLAYEDPALEFIEALNYLRLVDLRTEISNATITAANIEDTNNPYIQPNPTSFLTNLAIDDLVTVTLVDQIYRTIVSSINTSSSYFYGSRRGNDAIGTNANHTGRPIQHSNYRLYRIKKVEWRRDQRGILSAHVQADHFSYDMANLPFVVKGRTDLAFSQKQLGASRPEWEQSATDLLTNVMIPFSNSFAVGRVDFSTGQVKEAVFRSDTCLRAARSLAPIFDGDLAINEDGKADLLFFKGKHSGMSVIYGRNMEFLSKFEDASEIATSVYPIGASSNWEGTYTGLIQDFHPPDIGLGAGAAQTTQEILRLADPIQPLTFSGGSYKFRAGDVVTVFNDLWACGVASTSADGTIITLDNTRGAGLVSASWVGLKASAYRGGMAFVYDGTSDVVGQIRNIIDNGTLTVTIDRPFSSPLGTSAEIWLVRNPEITEVLGHNYLTGTASAGGAEFLADSTLAPFGANDDFIEGWVEIAGGTGVGQVRAITDSTYNRLDVSPDWDTVPDATSIYLAFASHEKNATDNRLLRIAKLKRMPTNTSYEVGASTVGQYSGGMVIKTDTEEPLTIGKHSRLRSTLAEYQAPAGTTQDTTISLVSGTGDPLIVTESGKFINIGRIRISEYLPDISITDPSGVGIPVKHVLETQINSFGDHPSGGDDYLICDNKPYSQTTLSDGTAYIPSTFASVEAVSVKDQSSIRDYGHVVRYMQDEQIHKPLDLYNDAVKVLAKSARPKTSYSVKFGELYEIDPLKYDTEKAGVGDLFDIYDQASESSSTGEDPINPMQRVGGRNRLFFTPLDVPSGFPNYTLLAASGYSYNLFDNQWRGMKLGFVDYAISPILEDFKVLKWYAILANSADSVLIEPIDTSIDSWYVSGVSSPRGFVVTDSLRIIQKTWNPFDPRQMTVEVSNAEDMLSSMPRVQLDAEQATKDARTATNNANTRTNAPLCMHWNPVQGRCVRSAPPNYFCNSSYSNLDGKLTADLKPITQAHCYGFQRPVDQDVITTTKSVVKTIVDLPYDPSPTDATSFTTVSIDLPVVVRDVSQIEITPISLTNDPSDSGGNEEQKQPAKVKTKIVLDDNRKDPKPFDENLGTGVEIQMWQTDINTSSHEATVEVSLSGSDGSYYWNSSIDPTDA